MTLASIAHDGALVLLGAAVTHLLWLRHRAVERRDAAADSTRDDLTARIAQILSDRVRNDREQAERQACELQTLIRSWLT